MKILVMSDLHVEFESGRGPSRPTSAWCALQAIRKATPGHPLVGPDLTKAKAEGVQLVLLAGDTAVGAQAATTYSREVSAYLSCPVVLVCGNHEAYGEDLEQLIAELRATTGLMPGSEVYFLENERLDLEVAGQPLIIMGCALWTDYALYGADKVDMAIIEAVGSLNDHVRIQFRGNRLHPYHCRQMHDVSRKWLARELARARTETPEVPLLVMTHHAPVADAIPPRYRGGRLSAAFASDLEAEIAVGELQGAALWACGHTHHSFQKRVGGTLVVSSQRGYVGSEQGADSYVPLVLEI